MTDHPIIRIGIVGAVVIGTWPYLHHAVTCEALEAGKHVLVEARLALHALGRPHGPAARGR